jgi:NTE family protein
MTIAVAVQGGGAHGALAWGVLDRLLEDGVPITRLCGVSSGALTATMLAQGLAQGGAKGGIAEARRLMRLLWERIDAIHTFSPLRGPLLERWLFGTDIGASLAWQVSQTALGLFGAAPLNPLGANPLRPLLADLLEPRALTGTPALAIAATDVATGAARFWRDGAITVEALLASCCVPLAMPPAEIDEASYWDGGFVGNPPLGPLLAPGPPKILIVVRAQPRIRLNVGTNPIETLVRISEIAGERVLATELAALPRGVRVVELGADSTLAALPLATKFAPDEGLIDRLFGRGRAIASGIAADL